MAKLLICCFKKKVVGLAWYQRIDEGLINGIGAQLLGNKVLMGVSCGVDEIIVCIVQ